MKKIENVNIGNVEVVIKGKRKSRDDYDFGALTLKREDREFILDVVQSYTEVEGNKTKITLEVEPDEDAFDECPYDLTKEDLLSDDIFAEIFVDGTFENKIISITFFFEVDGKEYTISVEQE